MHRRVRLALLAFLCSAGPVLPAPSHKEFLARVWSGTIGKAKVVACFEGTEEDGYSHGMYYYRKYLDPIVLTPTGEDGAWHDPSSSGTEWRIKLEDGGRASGQWIPAGGRKPLPIRLDVEDDGGGSPCASNAFSTPLESRVRIRLDTLEGFGGRCLRTRSAQEGGTEGSWLELCDTGVVAQRINEALPKGIDDTEEARAEFFDCRRSMFALRGTDGNFNQSTRPTLMTSRYLVVARHSDGYCGGPYPFSGTEHTTFDLATGEIVDLWSWIEEANAEQRTPPDTLLHLIRSKGARDTSDPADECLQTLASTDSYYPRLDSLGMIFATNFPHVVQACDEDYLVPYDELLPYLTPQAREEVRRIRKDLAEASSSDRKWIFK